MFRKTNKDKSDEQLCKMTSAQKWGIGTGIFPGIPAAVRVIKFLPAYRGVTLPVAATMISCGAVGYFGRKAYSKYHGEHEKENKLSYAKK